MKLVLEQVELLEKEQKKIIEKRKVLLEQKSFIKTYSYFLNDGGVNEVNNDEKIEIDRCNRRIREINSIIATSEIVTPSTDNQIEIGSYFKVHLHFQDDDFEIVEGILVDNIVTNEAVDKFFSVKSYLGKSILGKQQDDVFSWQLPNGDITKGKVLEINYQKQTVKTKK